MKAHRTQTAITKAREIVLLPEPPETWTFDDVELTHAELQRLNNKEVILSERNGERPYSWYVDERLYQCAKDHFEKKERLTCCGSRGVTNNDGDLECMNCGAPVTEEDFHRVMKGSW